MRQSGLQNFLLLASVFICISSFHYLDPWLVPLAVNKEIIICCLPANCVSVCVLVRVSACVCVYGPQALLSIGYKSLLKDVTEKC